ncbi:LETM1 domain-containing protein 1 isoform X2 [Passer montanus]|uniref:LETM1 domain-containing protein 1 isoform X2 n=1 Tax=Passer montanus TaxID=9160 RepID=UPI0019615301|nr:LETM1 domain-containing protein 1 isoform X2 [Passer montanus]
MGKDQAAEEARGSPSRHRGRTGPGWTGERPVGLGGTKMRGLGARTESPPSAGTSGVAANQRSEAHVTAAPRAAKMALPGAAARGRLWRLGPAALSPPRGPMQPQLALAASSSPLCSQVRSLSSRASSRALAAAVAAAARRVSARYERYLERSWPRFYLLHSTFKSGVQALLLEAQEIRRIRARMAQLRLSPQQLPYRDMERLRQFRRDVLKAIPIGIISIPPFANFLVLVLMYFFPRQLLIRHFWTPRQQLEFLDAYDCRRRASYPAVLRALARAARSLPEAQPQQLLLQLCAQVQGGAQPRLAQLLAVRSLFSGSLLVLNRLQVDHVRALSRVLFLTPHLPAFLLRRRLRSHVLEIQHLDHALLHLGLGQLSEEELRAACYLRGLNSTHLGQAECQAWLEQWLRLSCELQASEASLLAHSMVLLALNPGQPPE